MKNLHFLFLMQYIDTLDNKHRRLETTMNTKRIIIPSILVMGMMLLTIGSAAAVAVNIDGNVYWGNGTLCTNIDHVTLYNDTGHSFSATVVQSIGYYFVTLDDPNDIQNGDVVDHRASGGSGAETNTTASYTYSSYFDYTLDIHLDAPAAPADLIVESITPAPDATYAKGYYFAKEPNYIGVVIKNNGATTAPQSSVRVEITGAGASPWTLPVPQLAPGVNATVYVTDETIRDAGTWANITVTADCNNDVPEGAGEANNVTLKNNLVMKHGYKSKIYTGPTHPDGHSTNMTTWKTYDLNGDLVYSLGNSWYQSGSAGWTHYIVDWTAADLNVPSGATVKEARLNIPYCWAAKDAMENVATGNPGNYTLEFNGNPVPLDEHYWDTKFYDGKDYPYYGALAYNVTAEFNLGGVNTANLTSLWAATHGDHGGATLRGAVLVVIYEDATKPRRVIFANEGFDMLGASYKQNTTSEEATAWAIINPAGIFNSTEVSNARLVTFVPGANPNEGNLLFNQDTYPNNWNYNGGTGAHQIGVDDCLLDITHLHNDSDNEIGFQCRYSTDDFMETDKAFLVVTLGDPVIAIDQPTYVDPQSQFTINITVDPMGNDISAVQYDLYYNTSVVRAEWADPGPFLNPTGAHQTDVNVLEIDNLWDSAGHVGKISYAETTYVENSGTLPSVDTDGILTRIHFSAIGVRGTYTQMNLDDVLVSGPLKNAVLIDVEDCGVTIYNNQDPVANGTSMYRFSNVASKFQCFAVLCPCLSDGGPDDLPGWGENITYVRWDFGDGEYGTSEGVDPCEVTKHEYMTWNWVGGEEGYYENFTAYLTVRDNGVPQLSNTTEVEVMVYIAGDTDGDGKVNIFDLACVGKHWGRSATGPTEICDYYWAEEQPDEADLNNDGDVDTFDAMIVGTNWNQLAYPPYYEE